MYTLTVIDSWIVNTKVFPRLNSLISTEFIKKESPCKKQIIQTDNRLEFKKNSNRYK